MERFSSRQGLEADEPEIKIRDDAPYNLRGLVVDIAYESGLDPHSMRSIVCYTLRTREDQSNWSAYPNVDGEVRDHLDSCKWFEVYDIIESTCQSLLTGSQMIGQNSTGNPRRPDYFEQEINKLFKKEGIGWQLVEGQIQVRGAEVFQKSIAQANSLLIATNRMTAANEIHQSILDLSLRPNPDITGAMQHSIAALECVMRDMCGDRKATLGMLLSRYKNKIPSPLDAGIEKLWGFASEQGRHLQEGREPTFEEAELAVHVAGAVIIYLIRKS